MTTRPGLAAAGLAGVILIAIAACSGGATASPSGGSSPSAAAASTGASSAPSISIPSALASALASAAGTVPDAATLVTTDMAASVIGGSPTKVSPPMTIPNVSIASYSTTGGDSVTVFVEAIPGGVASAQLQAAIAMAGAQGQLQPVSGIGDGAGKVVNANDATVAFVKGNTLAVVQATSQSSTGSDLESKLEAIAKQVASKL